jgi:hypothetical protein
MPAPTDPFLISQLEADVLHAAALADLLEARWAALGVDFPVYRDQVPADLAYGDPGAYPYAVVYSAAGLPDQAAARLAGWGGEITTSHQITVAGLTSGDVLGAAGRCRVALHMQRPAAGGRKFSVVEHTGGPGRPVPDPERESGGQTVYSRTQHFALRSRPHRA